MSTNQSLLNELAESEALTRRLAFALSTVLEGTKDQELPLTDGQTAWLKQVHDEALALLPG